MFARCRHASTTQTPVCLLVPLLVHILAIGRGVFEFPLDLDLLGCSLQNVTDKVSRQPGDRENLNKHNAERALTFSKPDKDTACFPANKQHNLQRDKFHA